MTKGAEPSVERTATGKPMSAAHVNVCAEHGTELVRWKSSRQVKEEPKASRRARAQP